MTRRTARTTHKAMAFGWGGDGGTRCDHSHLTAASNARFTRIFIALFPAGRRRRVHRQAVGRDSVDAVVKNATLKGIMISGLVGVAYDEVVR